MLPQRKCKSSDSNVDELELLLDISSDIVIIKIDNLKGDSIVDETENILIRGLSQELIRTTYRKS